MARDQCPFGGFPYATKRECEDAFPGQAVHRCGRCRGWHPSVKKSRREYAKARRARRKGRGD